ncbi:MAG: acyl--CoA ligase [Spirochaetes bacterium]|nr:acyl--CoA ligase [Spirochaetota bacterium]
MNITERIFESLSGWSDHPAFIDLDPERGPTYVSAPQFSGRVRDAADILKKHGIRSGFIVALFLNNSIDFISIFLALMFIGAKPIPVNMAFRKIELDEIFANADPHAIIAERDHLIHVRAHLPGRIVLEREGGKLYLHDVGADAARREPAELGGDIASINYTYRGHGYPLGALVPHRQYLDGADVLEKAVMLERGERILAILPMQHIFTLIGCVFLPLLYGVTTVISYSRNPLRLFEAVTEHGIDYVLAVPELYELFLNLREAAGAVPRMKAFLSGGSVLPEEHYGRLMEEFGVELIHGYGLTEFTPVSRNIRGAIRPGTIGVISDCVECRIDSPDANGSGEIMIRTKNMARGYYRRPAETADAFHDGWFGTGDIGRIDNGHLIFEREKKGTRKMKGNMVDLEEVKKALVMYSSVCEAEVEYFNKNVIATVIINPSVNFNDDVLNIKRRMENIIAGYKIPKTINVY